MTEYATTLKAGDIIDLHETDHQVLMATTYDMVEGDWFDVTDVYPDYIHIDTIEIDPLHVEPILWYVEMSIPDMRNPIAPQWWDSETLAEMELRVRNVQR